MYVGMVRSDTNKGSSMDLATYLQKEDKDRSYSERTHFFNQFDDKIRKNKVVKSLDRNTAKLKRGEAKYFLIDLCPSHKEQAHILKRITGRSVNNLSELNGKQKATFEAELRRYSQEVMKQYASNFNREGLDENSLLWFAKIEHNRQYRGTDKAVLEGRAKSGQNKEGLNSHIHIMVSRKEKDNGRSISPFSRSKGSNKHKLNGKSVKQGFNRKEFIHSCEKTFDKTFNYDRSLSDHFLIKDAIKQSYRFEKQFNRVITFVEGNMQEARDKEVYHSTKEGKTIAKKTTRIALNTGIAYAKGGGVAAFKAFTGSSISSAGGVAVGKIISLAQVNPKLAPAVLLIKKSFAALNKTQSKDYGISR